MRLFWKRETNPFLHTAERVQRDIESQEDTSLAGLLLAVHSVAGIAKAKLLGDFFQSMDVAYRSPDLASEMLESAEKLRAQGENDAALASEIWAVTLAAADPKTIGVLPRAMDIWAGLNRGLAHASADLEKAPPERRLLMYWPIDAWPQGIPRKGSN